jgi:hypothetical protein
MKLDGQTPFGRRRLTGVEHAIDDQTFDALGDHIGHLHTVVLLSPMHDVSTAG